MILHTNIVGEGEPIMLIHSGGMTGTTEYEEQTEFFSKRNFKVIRPDLRGHGNSLGEIDRYFVRSVVDIKETLDSLHIAQCHIAGVSIGGVVALLFAKAFPEKVKTVTFSGIFPKKPNNWEELTEQEADGYETLFQNEEATSFLNEIHGENDWKTLLRSFNEVNFYPFEELGDVSTLK